MENTRDYSLLRKIILTKFKAEDEFFKIQSFFTLEDYEYIKTNEDKLPLHILFKTMNLCNVSLDIVIDYGFEFEYPSMIYSKMSSLSIKSSEKRYFKKMIFEYLPYYTEYENIRILFHYLSSQSENDDDIASFFKVITRYLDKNSKRFSASNIRYMTINTITISTFAEIKEWYFRTKNFSDDNLTFEMAKKYSIILGNLIGRSLYFIHLKREEIFLLEDIIRTYLMHIKKYKLHSEIYFYLYFIQSFNCIVTNVQEFKGVVLFDLNISATQACIISFQSSDYPFEFREEEVNKLYGIENLKTR